MSSLLEGLIRLVESQGYVVTKKTTEPPNNEPEINGMAEPPPMPSNKFFDKAKLNRLMQGDK